VPSIPPHSRPPDPSPEEPGQSSDDPSGGESRRTVPPESRTPEGRSPLKGRPWFLLAALVVSWVAGAYGATTGCTTVMFLRDGTVVDVDEVAAEAAQADDPTQAVPTLMAAARMKATAELSHRTFPLNVARMLLGALLVVASGMAMAGRPGSRKLAIQALAATAGLSIADYALTYPVRAAWIEAASQVARSIKLPPGQEALTQRDVWFWFERFRFAVLDLGALALAILALRHPRSTAYFDAMAAQYERQRREEEEEEP
jgi:hypothetical protein